ncbi:MAG: hypothetical protein H0A75_02565 [Candidatus Methanofishera endochildressiae]|uniref:Uncharacterized protein n=1 Tax=Candidatus Methanofishera endochildressiae TaxID=2738884 RepID=A0A7Z0MN16_9GAMM|nr:hypothetical protein [Candidatus Methanofishera endochildressiae]
MVKGPKGFLIKIKKLGKSTPKIFGKKDLGEVFPLFNDKETLALSRCNPKNFTPRKLGEASLTNPNHCGGLYSTLVGGEKIFISNRFAWLSSACTKKFF